MANRLRLIILGAPGSGKGTISNRIVKEFNLSHLSSGDILRANINKGTQTGLKVKDLVAKGQFVPDDLITRVVLPELSQLKAGWLLDGFPRTIVQAKVLDKQGVSVDRVINLNVPFDEIINRLKHRWIHPKSGRVYNLEFNPPKIMNQDDLTGETLVQRPDDQPDVVLRRLKEYENQTKPIVDFYNSKKILTTYTGRTSNYLWPLIQADLQAYAKSKGEIAPVNQENVNLEVVTHTGQQYPVDDQRRVRFQNVTAKFVNKNFAVDLVAAEPIVVSDLRVVCSGSAGALGHPKIYINIDSDGEHVCNYSGRRFIRSKFYDQAKYGKSITYQQYLDELNQQEKKFISSNAN